MRHAQIRKSGRNAALPLFAGIALLFASACGGPLEPRGAPGETRRMATSRTSSAATVSAVCSSGTDPHSRHLNAGFDCSACHPCGGQFGFANAVSFPQGTTSAGGTLALGSGTTPTTCAVGCHYPLGTPAHSIAWNAGTLDCISCHAQSALPAGHPAVSPTATRADCQVCHSASGHTLGTVTLVGHAAAWVDRASSSFHAYSANLGLAGCQQCHGTDLAGGASSVPPTNAPACASCHASGGAANDLTTCVACHGGTDNGTGAPPMALWGYAGDPNRGGGTADPVRVGAHTAHVTASDMAPAYDCGVCHVKPARLLDPGHIDNATDVPLATVTFGGIASLNGATTPVWERTTATCSSTYCHGATIAGGTNKAPEWTRSGQGQAACGTCHGVPPPTAPHANVTVTAGNYSVCNTCHSETISPSGAFVAQSAGGKHLDGILEASGHGASWTSPADPSNADFHAYTANRGIDNCTICHGADLSGGSTGVACVQCHTAGGSANDFSTCTACHGAADNLTGAPPRAIWGNTAPAAVGAHTSHVAGTHGIALPLDCATCHPKPVDMLTAGHIDGAVAVTGYTGSDPSLIASVTDPGWNPTTASCATSYCHGASIPGGSNRIPTWTVVDGSQAACGTCHANPPNAGRHYDHVGGGQWFANANCSNCHLGIATGSGNAPVSNGALVGTTLHVNGTRNVVFGGRYGGFPVGGYPAGTTARYSNGTCSNISCHRLLPDRGVGPYSWYP